MRLVAVSLLQNTLHRPLIKFRKRRENNDGEFARLNALLDFSLQHRSILPCFLQINVVVVIE